MSLRGRVHTVMPVANMLEFLMVACGQTHFALQADIVRGVIQPEEGDVEGVLSSYGLTTSPVHFSEHFGLTGSYLSPDSRILVCGMHSTYVAFRVDRVLGLHEIDSLNLKPLLPHFIGPERRWIAGMFLFQETVALVLHTQWLLSDAQGERVRFPLCATMAEARSVEPLQAPAMVPTAQHGSFDWNVMKFEEVTDADDTPWAQI